MDAVGTVDVGDAGRTEQDTGARRDADERVARRLGLVVGLRLDDATCALAMADQAADQVPRDVDDRSRVEARRERRLAQAVSARM